MALIPISAVEAVSPAIEWVRRLLFRPFRFGLWVRFAILGFVTGEMSNGGGFHFSLPTSPTTRTTETQQFVPSLGHLPPYLLPLIGVLVVALVVFVLVFMYLGSVFRFVLLEGIIAGRVRLREGFSRWQEPGRRFFVWQLVFALLFLAAMAVTVGAPLLLAWRAGLFTNAHAHVVALILGGILLLAMLLIVLALGMTIFVLTKDFVVPIMALEGIGPVAGWRQLLPMMSTQKGSFAAYIGMKIVLALGAGLLVTIVVFIITLLLLIPGGLAALLGYFAAQAAGLSWNVFTITAAIVAGCVLLALFFFLIAMLTVPVIVFFQCYVLQFFAGRYERLAAWMYPPPPPAPTPAAV